MKKPEQTTLKNLSTVHDLKDHLRRKTMRNDPFYTQGYKLFL